MSAFVNDSSLPFLLIIICIYNNCKLLQLIYNCEESLHSVHTSTFFVEVLEIFLQILICWVRIALMTFALCYTQVLKNIVIVRIDCWKRINTYYILSEIRCQYCCHNVRLITKQQEVNFRCSCMFIRFCCFVVLCICKWITNKISQKVSTSIYFIFSLNNYTIDSENHQHYEFLTMWW